MQTTETEKPVDRVTGMPNGTAEDAGHSTQVVSFKLGREAYGVSILDVQEVILGGEITTIPQVPPYVRGLINLRGSVIPIIDLRLRFGMEAASGDDQARIIVVSANNTTVGMVVDTVEQVLRINESQIEPPPTGLFSAEGSCVSGVVKLETSILTLLDTGKVLDSLDDTVRAHVGGTA